MRFRSSESRYSSGNSVAKVWKRVKPSRMAKDNFGSVSRNERISVKQEEIGLDS